MVIEPARVTDVLTQIVEPDHGDLSPELASYVLSLNFTPAQHARFAELSAKVQQGSLSEDEQHALNVLNFANTMLGVMQSKARQSIRRRQPAA
jgi:hypothetical protein